MKLFKHLAYIKYVFQTPNVRYNLVDIKTSCCDFFFRSEEQYEL